MFMTEYNIPSQAKIYKSSVVACSIICDSAAIICPSTVNAELGFDCEDSEPWIERSILLVYFL